MFPQISQSSDTAYVKRNDDASNTKINAIAMFCGIS